MLALMVGCTYVSNYTLRDSSIDDIKFLALADEKVANEFPQWYSEEVEKKIEIFPSDNRFAGVVEKKNGDLVIRIFPTMQTLRTVDDVALVLLHEYVHVKLWYKLDALPVDPICLLSIHELFALNVELTQTKLKATTKMLKSTKSQYASNYRIVRIFCPKGLINYFEAPEVARKKCLTNPY